MCKCILRGIHLILFFVSNHGKQLRNMVNKTPKVWNLQKAHSLRTIKICRFEIIDGVKYVYCIKHAYKFLLREQVGFAAVLDACVNLFLVNFYIGRVYTHGIFYYMKN